MFLKPINLKNKLTYLLNIVGVQYKNCTPSIIFDFSAPSFYVHVYGNLYSALPKPHEGAKHSYPTELKQMHSKKLWKLGLV